MAVPRIPGRSSSLTTIMAIWDSARERTPDTIIARKTANLDANNNSESKAEMMYTLRAKREMIQLLVIGRYSIRDALYHTNDETDLGSSVWIKCTGEDARAPTICF
jgi:hypothetical protein